MICKIIMPKPTAIKVIMGTPIMVKPTIFLK
jgi:hypothetical protein